MKKILFLNTFLLISIMGLAQTTHTLTGYDHYFEPDTLYMEPGDTVELVSVGYHSATEVDSADWASNTPTPNGGFYVGLGSPDNIWRFTIDTEGTYYNICVPHAQMGMKSVIIVESTTTDIDEQVSQKEFNIYPNPASNLIVVKHTSNIKIYDMMGKLVFEKSDLDSEEEIDISKLPKGIYNVVLDYGAQRLLKE